MHDSMEFFAAHGLCPCCQMIVDTRLAGELCSCTDKQMDEWLTSMLAHWSEEGLTV